MTIDRRQLLAAALAGPLNPFVASAQPHDHPLKVIVPYSPGSPVNAAGRLFADALTQVTRRPSAVENKTGAGSVIGSLEVHRAKPDGATILCTSGAHTTNAVLMRKLPYDSLTGFTPISLLTSSEGFALLVQGGSNFRTLSQWLAAAKKAPPGQYSFGTGGIGGTLHLFGSLFARAAGVELTHVPFRGQPTTEMIGGQIDLMFALPTPLLPHIQSGKLRVLAVSGKERNPRLPDVPTFKEFGINTHEVPAWVGLFGPPGMAPAMVDAMHRDIVKAVYQPAFRDNIIESGGQVVASPPAAFRDFVASEIARYKRILPPLKIQLD